MAVVRAIITRCHTDYRTCFLDYLVECAHFDIRAVVRAVVAAKRQIHNHRLTLLRGIVNQLFHPSDNDSGFDPGHVNWYDGAQTRNRLKYFYRNVGGAAEYRDGEAAKAYTDKPDPAPPVFSTSTRTIGLPPREAGSRKTASRTEASRVPSA